MSADPPAWELELLERFKDDLVPVSQTPHLWPADMTPWADPDHDVTGDVRRWMAEQEECW